MPFEIVRNDLAHVRADAVVLPSNEQLIIDGGAGLSVAEVAGVRKVRRACKALGGCPTGSAKATPAFKFPARYLIHTVGPVWSTSAAAAEQNRSLLRAAYDAALELSAELECESIALPLLSTGARRCPEPTSLEIALAAIRGFLEHHDSHVTLVLYSRRSMAAALDVFNSVAAFIDDTYASEHRPRREWQPDGECRVYTRAGSAPSAPSTAGRRRRRKHRPTFGYKAKRSGSADMEEWDVAASRPSATGSWGPALSEMPFLDAEDQELSSRLAKLDAGFSETLLSLIDERGLTDAQVYKRANISRQHFSKIRSNPAYRPTQKTALALCIALQLDLDSTRDLLARAGFTLSHARKFDVIVEYFIVHGNYDIFKINETLYAFDQPLLG